jgi:8-oxo-dGTP pyrophosphatase MutT (NUDIX family)
MKLYRTRSIILHWYFKFITTQSHSLKYNTMTNVKTLCRVLVAGSPQPRFMSRTDASSFILRRVTSGATVEAVEAAAAAASPRTKKQAQAESQSQSRPVQKVWRAESTPMTDRATMMTTTWKEPIIKSLDISSLLDRIGKQELQGGRMRQRQLGVLREDPAEDMRLLIENYTVPSLASALRDREEILQHVAELVKEGELSQAKDLLRPFEHVHVLARRDPFQKLNLTQELNVASLELLRKALMRMPRRVTAAHQKRAGVVLCLANVHGVPSLLLEKRAATLRAHPDEVCLPGGISMEGDQSIVATCLREMHEEIRNLPTPVSVLGILRCNWGDVHHLVGVAVTPLVAFVGEVGDIQLIPNPDEVSEVFSIPLMALLKRESWIYREGFAPIFVGGPHVIWGLTGYIVERFVKDILLQYTVSHPSIATAEHENSKLDR